jgi:hypothetical protein
VVNDRGDPHHFDECQPHWLNTTLTASLLQLPRIPAVSWHGSISRVGTSRSDPERFGFAGCGIGVAFREPCSFNFTSGSGTR